MSVRFAVTVLSAWLLAPAAPANEPLFGREVVPVLYKLGCSTGACHGSFSGKGTFRLSLFASDAMADFRSIRDGFGRRINLHDPEQSLILLKPTGRVAHGGDVKLIPGSDEYKLLKRWIEAGAKFDPASEGSVASVRVEPPSFILKPEAEPLPLKVLAKLSNGRELDVTNLARFEPFDPTIASSDAAGRITANRAGDTHVLAHYAGQIGFSIALVPGEKLAGLEAPKEKLSDSIDRLAVEKLQKLNIVPSPLCSDGDFLRRLRLDVTGQLPTPEEARAFLADRSPDKRKKKIDQLLADPLHAAVWATKFCDITGADNRVMYDKAVCEFHDWFRNKLEDNMPYDEIVRRVLTATARDERSIEELEETERKFREFRKTSKSSTMPEPPPPPGAKPWEYGYATRNTMDVFFANNKFRIQAGPDKGKIDPQTIALHVSTAFLGVRMECAECHKHPHDRWTQNDFRGFTAAFTYFNRGVDPALRTAHKVNVNGIHVTETPLQTFMNVDTGEPLGPRVLGGDTIEMAPGIDPRRKVWEWMVSPENPYFAKAIVNRVWAHYFGRGLIDPVDALAAGSPPSHPEIMDELVRDFVAHKYDLRHLHRRILGTVTYQRGWETNESNAKDERNLSHRVLRRISAEQALDAVALVTGTPVELDWVYTKMPNRKIERAIECPTSRPGGGDSYLMKIFDKPQRTQSCDCERAETPNLSQSLYFYNDASLVAKIADKKGRLTKLLESTKDDAKVLEELYLTALTRYPTKEETAKSLAYVKAAPSRSEGFEDVLWSLMNRQEFVVGH